MKTDLKNNKKIGEEKEQTETQVKSRTETSKSPKRFSRGTWLIGAGVIVFILLIIIGRPFGGGEEDEAIHQAMIPQEVTDGDFVDGMPDNLAEKDDGKEEKKDEDKDNEEAKIDEEKDNEDVKTYEEIYEEEMGQVRGNLINPDAEVEDTKEVKKVLTKALKQIEELVKEDKPYVPKEGWILGRTDAPVAHDIMLGMQAGYKADVKKSVWTQGTTDYTYQFVIPMFKEGHVSSAFAFLSGNYNIDDGRFNIVRAEGFDFSSLASPTPPGAGWNFQQGAPEE